MDIYTEDDFDEYIPVSKPNFTEPQQEEKFPKPEVKETKEEVFEEEINEEELEDIDTETVEEVLAKSSTEARCTILEEEIRLLKLENDLLLTREKSLKERLEVLDSDNNELNARLLDYERELSTLNKEIELVKCRSEARQSTLENNYRELCGKMASSEQANQKMRLDLNQERAKNAVLEELVETKNAAIEELDRRLDHITPSQQFQVKVNGNESESEDKVKDLTYKLQATERQLDQVVSELSKVVSSNSSFKSTINAPTKSKYLDYHAMLRDYNSKCVKLKEMEERLYNDENKTKVLLLEDKIKVLNESLSNKNLALKENEKALKEFYSKQMDDLRATISEHKTEITSKEEEITRTNKNCESLKHEMEVKNKLILEKTEEIQLLKSQNSNLNQEIESHKRKINDQLENIRNLNREKELVQERENTHIAEFKNYSKETDLKVKKLELVLKHAQVQALKAKPKEQKEDEQLKEQSKIESEFRTQLLEELSVLKQSLTSLERSKKEQQQNNNLILTLRHQNDTAINTLREENKNSLNSLSEKNKAVLMELKEENANVVAKFMEQFNNLFEKINDRSDTIVNELKEQFQVMKDHMKELEAEKLANTEVKTPASLEEPPVESSDTSLAEKYNKLKESFKETTTSLLKKEKVLLDSLKKSVIECHNYKTKLEELRGATPSANSGKCRCHSLVKPKNGFTKKVKSCWCKFKNSNNLRHAVNRRAQTRESELIQSLEKPQSDSESMMSYFE